MAGLYVHIPLCHSKCAYCDFHSFPANSAIGRYVGNHYVDALLLEWQMRRHELPLPPSTIYIGGGTPSIMSPDNLRRLIDVVPLDNVIEFTIEANPEDVTPQWVSAIKDIGINRVSIGVQSLDDNLLRLIGRRHSAKQALHAIDILANRDIQNISADLIYGLPDQTIESWQESVATLLSMPITHLSAYSLMYEPGTKLSAMLRSGHITRIDESAEENMYHILISLCRDTGMEHYEISNFSLPGYRSRHNTSYWDFTPYLGLGPGAHSFDGIDTRRANPADSRRYIDAMSRHKTVYEEEKESADDRLNDIIITALRTSDGLPLESIVSRFGHDTAKALIVRAKTAIAAGNIIHVDNRLIIPESKWLISNAILRSIIV